MVGFSEQKETPFMQQHSEAVQSTVSYVGASALASSPFLVNVETTLHFTILGLAVVIGMARAVHDVVAAYRKVKNKDD